MENEFYSTRLKCVVKQIDKRAARKLFEQGEEIFLMASNLRFDNVWTSPMPLKKESPWRENFDTIINEFTYYNCDNESGKYIHFYIKK